jgi:hypothetical protein
MVTQMQMMQMQIMQMQQQLQQLRIVQGQVRPLPPLQLSPHSLQAANPPSPQRQPWSLFPFQCCVERDVERLESPPPSP